MSLKEDECIMSEEGLDELIKLYSNTSGIRDLEQAAEHIVARPGGSWARQGPGCPSRR